MNFSEFLSLHEAVAIFLLSTMVIAVGGTKLSKEADRLADLSGLGEAVVGAILLGAITSLPGLVTSFTAALECHPQLSVSNAIGGIAFQTLFLAVADLSYPKANLEHAAASLSNVMQAILLMLMLALLLAVNSTPEILIFGIHPASLLLIIAYVVGQKMINKSKELPMWQAVDTKETRQDIPDKSKWKEQRQYLVILRFFGLGLLIAVAGYLVAKMSIIIVSETEISESVMGAMFTSLSSSLPELIVSIAAVRQGALTLAVSNIIGGNTFDLLFVSFSDMAYQQGSIIHTFENGQIFIITLTLILTGVLTLGLLDREKKGVGRIGWETALIIGLFLGGYVLLVFI